MNIQKYSSLGDPEHLNSDGCHLTKLHWQLKRWNIDTNMRKFVGIYFFDTNIFRHSFASLVSSDKVALAVGEEEVALKNETADPLGVSLASPKKSGIGPRDKFDQKVVLRNETADPLGAPLASPKKSGIFGPRDKFGSRPKNGT